MLEKHPVRFFIFGMGARGKLVYRQGELFDPFSLERIARWEVTAEKILPADYKVVLETRKDGVVIICEDEKAVWLEEKGKRRKLSEGPLKLPSFEGRENAKILRQLHHELLVSIVKGVPLPNIFVYAKPWYRDAAMLCMCLEKTGNLDLVKDWIMSIREPFDYNNGGVAEADNLGEVLYMVSLVSGTSHPVVEAVMRRIPEFRRGRHIFGLTDFGDHPVFQTKWLKFGLASLALPDDFIVPDVYDPYGSLFWMDFKDQHIEGPRFDEKSKKYYPYLEWAEGHFYGKKREVAYDPARYPISWEAEASQANYDGMSVLSPVYTVERVCCPHSWHAAEMFLALL